jgi:discoidin domain receptor family member 2
VLLSADLVPMIGDFGLSRQLESAATEHTSAGSIGPFRHMPPESIRKGKYSEASDVWAFGVTAWETFTNGEVPYKELRLKGAVDIVRKILEDHYRLSFPQRVPPSVISVLTPCWRDTAAERPSFADIVTDLDTAAESAGEEVVYASLAEFSAQKHADLGVFRE